MGNTSQQAKRKSAVLENVIATPNDAKLAHSRRVTQQTDTGIIHQRIGLYVLRGSGTCHQSTHRFTLRQVELFVGQTL
ncbi:MAG: hypothetical protein HOO95_05145 [Gallionella sp.]|nr:hypothetical protein [Gallionella sp.]